MQLAKSWTVVCGTAGVVGVRGVFRDNDVDVGMVAVKQEQVIDYVAALSGKDFQRLSQMYSLCNNYRGVIVSAHSQINNYRGLAPEKYYEFFGNKTIFLWEIYNIEYNKGQKLFKCCILVQ